MKFFHDCIWTLTVIFIWNNYIFISIIFGWWIMSHFFFSENIFILFYQVFSRSSLSTHSLSIACRMCCCSKVENASFFARFICKKIVSLRLHFTFSILFLLIHRRSIIRCTFLSSNYSYVWLWWESDVLHIFSMI